MTKTRCLNDVFRTLALAAIIILSASGQAAAGDKPSASTCNDLGFIDITCVVCATGEKIGKISIQAEYDSQYDDCMKRYMSIPGTCARAYNRKQSEVGGTWSYWMGVTRYFGNYPKNCK